MTGSRTVSKDAVKIVECPRDAWQGLPRLIPTETKVRYLRALIDSGFEHIDAVSFVSPESVPQMADAERVLAFLDPPDTVEILGVVVNEKGAERAIQTGAVQTLGFPYSLSPEFLRRNQRQTPEEAVETLEKVGTLAFQSGLSLVAYVSMAFGNPYGDPWSEEEVAAGCELLAELGVQQISLADTVGAATPRQIASLVQSVVRSVICERNGIEIGVHLHARPGDGAERIAAAYEAGCRRFDMALGGLGGCPFAQDVLVGNVATEEALAELSRLGAKLPRLGPLDELLTMSGSISASYGPNQQ